MRAHLPTLHTLVVVTLHYEIMLVHVNKAETAATGFFKSIESKLQCTLNILEEKHPPPTRTHARAHTHSADADLLCLAVLHQLRMK